VSEGTLSVNGYLGGGSALLVQAGAAVGGSGVIAGGIAGVTPSVVSVSSAAFTGGPAVTTGSVTQFVIVPEPGTIIFAGWSLWKRRMKNRFISAN